MDPKAIYNASNILLRKVQWKVVEGNEWIHIDTDEKFREQIVLDNIMELFQGGDIYIVIDRRNVFEVCSTDSLKIIREHMKNKNVILWDRSLKKAMLFDSIGVFKYGQVAT